MKLTGSLVMRW